MNNSEINLKIAKAKGLDAFIKKIQGNDIVCYRSDYGVMLPIDYISNPALNCELRLELLAEYWILSQNKNDYIWSKLLINEFKKITDKNERLATALAWIEEFCKE